MNDGIAPAKQLIKFQASPFSLTCCLIVNSLSPKGFFDRSGDKWVLRY